MAITTINFVGDGVTAARNGDTLTVTIPGGSGTAATQSEVNTGTATTVYVNPATLQDRNDTAVALTDQATIDITGPKHTLATASSRTFTISHAGDDIVIELTLSATSATMTFPATALCVSEGTASGDNTCALSGTSGDKYIIGIFKVGSNYHVGCKNMGQ